MTFSGRIVAHVSKITTTDERLIADAGEDKRPERLVVTQFCHYVNETLLALHAKRVAFFRIVKRNPRDPACVAAVVKLN